MVVQAGNLLGESPVWDEIDACLWWVDIHGRSLHCWRERTGHGAWPLPEQVGSVGLHRDGGLICATRAGFGRFDLRTGELAQLAAPLAGRLDVRFNDGRCDRHGRFWSGTVQEKRVVGGAALFRLDSDGFCTQMLDGITVANAIAFSPDDRTMYIADSHVHEIYAMSFDGSSGRIGERRLFARLDAEMGMPDGATVDVDGCLWVAGIGGGQVLRYTPAGKLDRAIDLPVSQPTSCEFGGSDLATLFVTSARMKRDDAALQKEPLAGSIFAIDAGTRGLPEPRYGRIAG